MSGITPYPKAPITEAIIDIQVELPEGVKLDQLRSVLNLHRIDYPETQELLNVNIQVESIDREPAQKEITGFRARNSNSKYIFQSRFNGFSLSRLAPYESWPPFRDEAKKLWETYNAQLQPVSIKRVAVRYVNRIDIPADSIEIKEYFRTYPELSPELPQQMAGFFLQVLVPIPDIGSQALINQTILKSNNPRIIPVVLDIDLFQQLTQPPSTLELWDILELLRFRKNRIFESCITDKTRKLFE